jgi:hypothetical protein
MPHFSLAVIATLTLVMNAAPVVAEQIPLDAHNPNFRTQDVNAKHGRVQSADPPTSEVAGIRIVSSTMLHDIYLKPSAWMLRNGGYWANADAKVYQNPSGVILGLTLTAWGLPDSTRYNEADKHYVVWLVNREENRVLNIGELEAHNGGRAVFGFTPEHGVQGYDGIAITQERQAQATWPSGGNNLEGALPKFSSLPPPIEPIVEPPVAPDQLAPMDERRGTAPAPLRRP